MFTGIVELCLPVLRYEPLRGGARLVLPPPGGDWRVTRGESIAVAGTCLTVAALRDAGGAELPEGSPQAQLLFDLSSETLERTWFSELAPGRLVNLERPLRLSDRIGGHLVSGHVDGLATLVEVGPMEEGGQVYGFECAPGHERYLVDKGSVTLDGVSLTVVRPRGRRFDCALIPHTLDHTNLGAARVGQRFNLEADLIGKWVERLLSPLA